MKDSLLKFSIAIVSLSLLCDVTAGGLITRPRSARGANDLVESARKGDLRAVEAILARGVDVNAKSKDGETALAAGAGAYEGYDEVVELLLERGARVDERSLGHSAGS